MSLKPLEQQVREFWSAAWFFRRAPERDMSQAVKILQHVENNYTGKLSYRAGEILRDVEDIGAA